MIPADPWGTVPEGFGDLWSSDRARQGAASLRVLDLTSEPVAWSGDVWDEVVANLDHPDATTRSIAAEVLCNLAAADRSGRVVADLPKVLAVTRDPRYGAARRCLQALWRVGIPKGGQRDALLDAVEERFVEAAHERSGALVRGDLIAGLRRLHGVTGDDSVRIVAWALIGAEEDPDRRAGYARHWQGVPA